MRENSRIKNVVIHKPLEENKEEFQKKVAKVTATIVIRKYIPETVEIILERLKSCDTFR